VVRSSLSADVKAKFKQFMMDLPKTDAACFAAVEGGEYKGFVEVNSDFYKPIIDARKSTIGG
ncbi:MAG: phosphonate ABC transporter substrate-binding protein, partial [Pararhizobium sp.]